MFVLLSTSCQNVFIFFGKIVFPEWIPSLAKEQTRAQYHFNIRATCSSPNYLLDQTQGSDNWQQRPKLLNCNRNINPLRSVSTFTELLHIFDKKVIVCSAKIHIFLLVLLQITLSSISAVLVNAFLLQCHERHFALDQYPVYAKDFAL